MLNQSSKDNVSEETINMNGIVRRRSSAGVLPPFGRKSSTGASFSDIMDHLASSEYVKAEFTVDEPPTIEKWKLWPQVLVAFSISFGNMIIGLVSAYSATALASLNHPNSTVLIDIDGPEATWIGSLMPLAALLGGILGGSMTEFMGRKGVSLLMALPMFLSWIMIALAPNVLIICIGRTIGGFCVGVASLSLPLLMAENVRPEVRGMLGLLPTTIGNGGILVCYVAGMYMDWSQLAYFCGILSLPYLLTIVFVPESPRWLLAKGRDEDAKCSLYRLRLCKSTVDKEFSEIKQICLNMQTQKEVDIKISDFGFSGLYYKPMMVALGLMALQQLCGINPVIFYTVYIFQVSGSNLNPHLCTIIIGIANFIATLVANIFVDKVGRKVLLIISDIVMLLSLLTLGTYFFLRDLDPTLVEPFKWVPLGSFTIFVVAFSLGLGPIPWIVLAEIFPLRIRAMAGSVVTAFHWILTFGIVKAFPYLVTKFGPQTAFYLFAVICLLGVYFIIRKVPETRGRSLEQIERKLIKSKSQGTLGVSSA